MRCNIRLIAFLVAAASLPLVAHAQQVAGDRDAQGDTERDAVQAQAVYDHGDAWRGRGAASDEDSIAPLGVPANDDRGRGDEDTGYVSAEDVNIVYQPTPQNYQPDGNLDASDAGKSFAIDCVISDSGRLGGCYAEDNDLNDQNFVRLALENARQWVVAPQLRNGGESAGRTFRLVCRFDRLSDERAESVASNDR